MPPKRRSGGAVTPTTRTQSTLSFNNKSRVTKQSNIQPPASDKKKPSSSSKRLSDQAQAEIINTVSVPEEKPQVVELAQEDDVAPQSTVEEEPAVSRPRRRVKKDVHAGYELRASEAATISDAKITAYWKAEEDSRLAPRVHQKDVHLHEKILRHFDLSSQYGPCIGISRLERWKRADRLGMEPPLVVLAVLLKEEGKGADRGVGGRQCGQLAYIDELAGGRVVLVE